MRIGAVPGPGQPARHRPTTSATTSRTPTRRVVATDARDCCRGCARRSTGVDVRYLVRGVAGSDVVELDAALAAQSDELDPAPTHRDDMAFWLYSSGSTGKPKGVVHLHHDIEVTCETYARQVLGLREDDVDVLDDQALPRLRAGQQPLVPALVRRHGGAHGGPADAPSRSSPTLREHRPTVFFSVPALYAALVREDGRRRRARLGAPVRLGRRGAAAADLRPLAGALRPGDRRRHRLDRDAAHLLLQPAGRGRAAARPAGRCPGYELRIVDEDGRVLEGPAVGNLEVRGDSCAAFYWHQHEKTKACMRGDWFTTGDRYERREDGAYVYVGRTDDMLKVGGLWVSPIDMENVLVEHPRVRRPPAWSASRSTTRAASRPSSSAAAARRRTTQLAEELRAMVQGAPAPLRVPARRATSSTSCRARPPARCSASSCARWRRRRRSADWLCRVRTRGTRRHAALTSIIEGRGCAAARAAPPQSPRSPPPPPQAARDAGCGRPGPPAAAPARARAPRCGRAARGCRRGRRRPG